MSVDDDQPEVLFRAKLQRETSDTPWGFRLQGGVEFDTPLTLLKVTADSVASRCGLNAGDIVVRLSGQPAGAMTHLMAQQTIASAGNTLEIIVQRAEVTLPSQPDTPVVDKTALSADRTPVDGDLEPKSNQLKSSNVVKYHQSSNNGTTDSIPCDVVITPTDVTRNHSDQQQQKQWRERGGTSLNDVISDQKVVSRHSTAATSVVVANGDRQMQILRTEDSANSPGEKRVLGASGDGIWSDRDVSYLRSRDGVSEMNSGDGVASAGESNLNIPQTAGFSSAQVRQTQPVEALITTDAVSLDQTTSGSIADGSSDATSDCASEISDEVASVIEMPITTSGKVSTDVSDDGRLDSEESVGGYDDAESGICPDYDSVDDGLFSPSNQSDMATYFRQTVPLFVESQRDRSPTPTPPGNSETGAPASTTSAGEGRHLVTRNEIRGGNNVVSSHVSVNIRGSRGDGSNGNSRRDFSQTAPWRVSALQQRSFVSPQSAGAVSASFSDPDIASSSAADERAAASETVNHRRRRAELEITPRVSARSRDVTGVGETVMSSPSRDKQSNVIHIPISFSSTTTTPPNASRNVTISAAAATATDRPHLQATTSTNDEPKSVSGPGCYIPQRPPPLPMPGSAGPDPRSSRRSVRSTTTSEETVSKSNQPPTLLQQTATVSLRRRSDDAIERRTRQNEAAALDQYVDEQADLPSRPVREMVAELNSRLEKCERSAAGSGDGATLLDSPYGSRYDLREAEAARGRRRSSSGSDSEREIIIDTPPASVTPGFGGEDQPIIGHRQRVSHEALRADVSGPSQSPSSTARPRPIITPTVAYHGTIVYNSPSDILQLSPRSARRFSLPTGSFSASSSYPNVIYDHVIAGPDGSVYLQQQQQPSQPRKVRFAEPPESSVIEIESSRRRRRTAEAAGGYDAENSTRSTLPGDWRGTRHRSCTSTQATRQPAADDRYNDEDTNDWMSANTTTTTASDSDYGSVTSLNEKLDRIELEHALASAAMRRSRPFQQQQQQQQPQQTAGGVPWNQSSSEPTINVVGGPTHLDGNGQNNGGRQQVLSTTPAGVKLEPIRERVISIKPLNSTMPAEYSALYDDYGSGNSGNQTPVVGGLRYLFRRRSNADIGRPVAQRSAGTHGGGFSVSIGPSTAGGGRLSLLVQPTSPGTRVNLVIPPSSNVVGHGGTASFRGSSGNGHVTYSISTSSPISRSLSPSSYTLPPTYEESIRGATAAAAAASAAATTTTTAKQSHQRSPSLQDFNAASGILPGVSSQQQRQQQQQQLSVPGIMINNSPSSFQPEYSQTLQVDTGLRQYQSQSSSPRYGVQPNDPLPPAVAGGGRYTVYRPPPSIGRSPADRQARLEQIRGRPHSGDIDVTTPGATGTPFDTGRSSSPLILAPTGHSNRQMMSSPSRPSPYRQMTSPEIGGERSLSSPMTIMPVMSPQMSSDSLQNYSGILAFFDKSFTDKILHWQAQRSRDGDADLQQSETYKLVREMDKQQRKADQF